MAANRRSAGATDRGAHRSRNEDSFFADDALGLYIVADGVGGRPHGDVASSLAVEVCASFVRATRDRFGPHGVPLARTLDAAIQASAATIHGRGRFGSRGKTMATTLSLLLVQGHRAAFAHVGDSRIYRLRGGVASQMTCDHTVAGELLASGDMTPEQADASPLAHVLTRCVGKAPAVATQTAQFDIEDGDLFVLASDGVNPGLRSGSLRALASGLALDHAPATLIGAALREGSRDNLTAVVVACGAATRDFHTVAPQHRELRAPAA